jgi:ATP-dependent RNA helicase DeaD
MSKQRFGSAYLYKNITTSISSLKHIHKRLIMSTNSTFEQMPLSEGMLKTIELIGYTQPTPIQEKSIPELLKGRDVLGQAQTGTGKTAAFAIPLIEKIEEKSSHIQALVVCPTRELCLQVCEEIKRLSAHTKGISTGALYGGQHIEQQFKLLKGAKPQIIVATPGRLFDHLRRKSVDLSRVNMIVLDEADEMLDMGFRAEIEEIFELLPQENQRLFFSATMPKPIMDLVHSYLRDPVLIKTEQKNLTAPKITQSYFRVRGKEKTDLLCRVLDYRDPKLAVVFCNAKSTADEIVIEIKSRGFEAGVLHGDLSQNQRDRVMAQFKAGQVRVLVATDIAARGIDIDDIELVLNYHLPHDPEDYVHRIGRTGRAGRKGRAVSLVDARDNTRLRRISQFARADILEEEPPTLNDVKIAKLTNLFGRIKIALSSDLIGEYKAVVAKHDLNAEDIAAGMIKLALEKFDENAKHDLIAEHMRGKKYSGFSPDKRRERSGERGGERRERPERSDRSERSERRPRAFADYRRTGPEKRTKDYEPRSPRGREDKPAMRSDKKPAARPSERRFDAPRSRPKKKITKR